LIQLAEQTPEELCHQ